MIYTLAAFAIAASLAVQDAPQNQNSPPAPAPAALRETRHHFDLVAARATAYIRSADSIDSNLRYQGALLHPELVILRQRIIAALNEAGEAISEGDLVAAEDALDRAQALVDRLARQIGGY